MHFVFLSRDFKSSDELHIMPEAGWLEVEWGSSKILPRDVLGESDLTTRCRQDNQAVHLCDHDRVKPSILTATNLGMFLRE